jgi:hypothetical protein
MSLILLQYFGAKPFLGARIFSAGRLKILGGTLKNGVRGGCPACLHANADVTTLFIHKIC